MKKFAFVFAILFSALMFGQETAAKKVSPPEGNALVGDSYGAGVTAKVAKKAISPATLEKNMKKSQSAKNVVVKGKVTEVCEKKGCWITIETDDNDKFFVKMKDYGFFVPTALKGKTVVMEGNAENKIISVDEQKHYAEDAKKPQEEIDAITEPKEEIRFVANGIRVVE